MQTIQSQKQLDALKQDSELLLLYFGSETCGVCRDMLPKLERLLLNYPKIQAAKVDVEAFPEIAANHQFFSIPAILLLAQGKETIRIAGIISLDQLEPSIRRYYDFFNDSRT